MKNLACLCALLCALSLPSQAQPFRVVFVSGSFEYDSDAALALFQSYLEAHYEVEITFLRATDWDVLPGLEALETCDAALFYTRRLTLGGADLKRIRDYVDSGRPLAAVRTASHGFQKYLQFDAEVLGGHYDGHFGEGPTTEVETTLGGRDHPILAGVGRLRSRYSLYKTKPLKTDATPLLVGKTPFSEGRQPVAWTREQRGGRVFYTSLGGVGDFEGDSFKRMLANALFWTARREPQRKADAALSSWERKSVPISFTARSRDDHQELLLPQSINSNRAAVLICDMWDKHWCSFASERVAAMAEDMNRVIAAARTAGMLIVHAPSETLGFYAEHPARRRIQGIAAADPPLVKQVDEPPLPIDDSDGGCPEPDVSYGAWTRQQPAIEIKDSDVLSDDGREICAYLRQHGIDTIFYMGVHTNMCVLGRSFGIRQMTRWGMNCFLVRDLTDSMYNPAMPPQTSHDEGTALVVRHIERWWAPTLTSEELLTAVDPNFRAARETE